MTNDKQVTVVERATDVVFQDRVSPGHLSAIQALMNRQVPPEVITRRPGPGGKMLDYIPHPYVTRTLVEGLDMFFSHDVLEGTPGSCGLRRTEYCIIS